MINGDFRRSGEFFRKPEETGRAACMPALQWREIVAFHALIGIIYSLSIRYGILLNPDFPQILQEFTKGADEQAQNLLRNFFEAVKNGPIRLSIFATLASLLSGTVLWVVGRNFNANITLREVQTGFVQIEFLRQSIGLAFAVLGYVLASSALGAVIGIASFTATIWLFVIYILVVKGIFALETIGKSILLVILSGLATIGATYFIGLVTLPLLFLGSIT